MRCYYNGSGFTVSFNEDDSYDFATNWPGSSVEGRGAFSFDANGDLCDISGVEDVSGPDWLAFVEDCKSYGMPRYAKRCKVEADREWLRRYGLSRSLRRK